MKLMLVCAGGVSTGMLVKKMEKWADSNGKELEVKAFGISEYDKYFANYEYVLLGPQISYKEKEIKDVVGDIPVQKIDSMDYALGNVDNIMKKAGLF